MLYFAFFQVYWRKHSNLPFLSFSPFITEAPSFHGKNDTKERLDVQRPSELPKDLFRDCKRSPRSRAGVDFGSPQPQKSSKSFSDLLLSLITDGGCYLVLLTCLTVHIQNGVGISLFIKVGSSVNSKTHVLIKSSGLRILFIYSQPPDGIVFNPILITPTLFYITFF